MIEGQMIYVGSSKNLLSAAQMYNEAAIKHHGEFAALNDLTDKGG